MQIAENPTKRQGAELSWRMIAKAAEQAKGRDKGRKRGDIWVERVSEPISSGPLMCHKSIAPIWGFLSAEFLP